MPPCDFQTEALGHEEPWLDVGFVLHLREDDLVAGVEDHGLREVHEELRCRCAEDDFIAAGINVFCGCLVTFFVFGVGLRAGVVRSSELNIGFGKVLRYADSRLGS